ncbi:NADH-quinone oxidoreductase subunit C [Salinithrix halophila]|uniref:NADH-quinone oxidoreductase subunit C n=1 Tax=Salinithrix halophila TaxID=1485204 RepID=A0ABV8JG71_9BACL
MTERDNGKAEKKADSSAGENPPETGEQSRGDASETRKQTQESPSSGAAAEKRGTENEPSREMNGESEGKVAGSEKDLKTKTAAAAKAAAAAKPKVGSARKRPSGKKPEEPLEPSPKQPLLDAFVAKLKQGVGEKAVEDSFINRLNGHLPTLVIPAARWLEVARFIKEDESFAFDFLQNLSGVDYETHMEVVVHLYSLEHRHSLCVRVKTDREASIVPSVTQVWQAADWNEREVYDLLGIRFTEHPNLKRILMPDDWVGHPLRKDYQAYDGDI